MVTSEGLLASACVAATLGPSCLLSAISRGPRQVPFRTVSPSHIARSISFKELLDVVHERSPLPMTPTSATVQLQLCDPELSTIRHRFGLAPNQFSPPCNSGHKPCNLPTSVIYLLPILLFGAILCSSIRIPSIHFQPQRSVFNAMPLRPGLRGTSRALRDIARPVPSVALKTPWVATRASSSMTLDGQQQVCGPNSR